MTNSAVDDEAAFAADLAEYSRDPLGFVLVAFEEQPRKFQREILADIRDHLQNPATRYMPYRCVIASGHGIGKTALMGQVVTWALSTCEDCRIEGSAGTGEQLKIKTVPEIQSWISRSINSDWFELHSESIRVKDNPVNWRADFTTWNEDNPQASAGLHNAGRRSVILFDEASTIPRPIWEAKYGVFSDENTEIIMLAFSQEETNNSYFGTLFANPNWHSYRIDSRDVEGTNKQLIQEQIDEHGEESDYVRVRWRGLPPLSNETQFIKRPVIEACQRYTAEGWNSFKTVAALDVSRGGSAQNVLMARQGRKATLLGRWRNADTTFTAQETIRLCQAAGVDMLVVDADGLGGPVLDMIQLFGFKKSVPFNGGHNANDSRIWFNRRAEVWGAMRTWLEAGAEIPRDNQLASELAAPLYYYSEDKAHYGAIQLEKKDAMALRGIPSPDNADALAMTFAVNVVPGPIKKAAEQFRYQTSGSWMGG